MTTIEGMLEKYTTPVTHFDYNASLEKEQFAYQVEEQILQNQQIKAGDILLIRYEEVGVIKYAHAALLTKGKTKRLVLTGKFGLYNPVVTTSIANQVNHYLPLGYSIQIQIYRSKK